MRLSLRAFYGTTVRIIISSLLEVLSWLVGSLVWVAIFAPFDECLTEMNADVEECRYEQ